MNRHEKIRLAGIDRVCEMIDMAIDMGAEYFIFHPGRLAFYSMSTKRVFFMEQRHPEYVMELLSDSLKRLISHCGTRITLCLENTHAVSSSLLKVLGRLAAEDGLSLVWDVGHTEQLPEARRAQLIRFFQDNIKHVKLAHLHDIREESEHKSLGSGRLDVAAYLEIFNAMGIDIILEIFPESELLSSLEYVKNISLKENRINGSTP
jgi:sugar phosphate isomerase/epimerase